CANNPASVGPGPGTTTITPVVGEAGLANFDVTAVNGSYTITPSGGLLFAATDAEEFAAEESSRLAISNVLGHDVTSMSGVTTPFPLNGIANGGGFLYGGDPETNGFRKLDFAGNLISEGTSGVPNFCCNE